MPERPDTTNSSRTAATVLPLSRVRLLHASPTRECLPWITRSQIPVSFPSSQDKIYPPFICPSLAGRDRVETRQPTCGRRHPSTHRLRNSREVRSHDVDAGHELLEVVLAFALPCERPCRNGDGDTVNPDFPM